MKIHTAGIGPILFLLSGVLLILFIFNWIFPVQGVVHYVLYALGFVFMFLVIRFFRFPARTSPLDEDAVYSVADGKVVAIEKVHVDEYFNDERIQVSVFMSALNVHVNWSPFEGEVIYREHHQGKHMVAFNPKSSFLNEHSTLVVRDSKGREVMFRQIAGAVARRIICKPKKGGSLKLGEVMGMIKFGSRIDLLLPLDADVKVSRGDKTIGSKTLIAKLP